MRGLLQGSGTANFDDIAFSPVLTMTLSTGSVPFGSGLKPDGSTSDQADAGAGHVDGGDGAYYVKKNATSGHAVTVTVNSSAPWDGSVRAAESTGTSGMSIGGGSLRWKLNDMSSLADAKAGTAFITSADSAVFNTARSCSSGSAKGAGVCTYNFDYSLRVRWTDAPGTFSSVITYCASQ